MKRPHKEESLRWLTQAKDEFQDADDLIFYTHSIDDLLEMTVDIDSDFKEVAQAKKLDKYYIPTRYPNGLPGGVPSRFFDDPKEAKEAMELAKRVIELVEKKTMEAGP